MNERIKELCKEAAEVHLKTMSPKTHTTPLYLLDKLAQSALESGIEIVSDGFCEKFAELIVKDITTEVKMGIESSTINLESSPPDSGGIHYWEGYRHASDDILVYIKEHFGVEK